MDEEIGAQGVMGKKKKRKSKRHEGQKVPGTDKDRSLSFVCFDSAHTNPKFKQCSLLNQIQQTLHLKLRLNT